MPVIFDRYESFMYQQWLRVYMRSQMIKHNKDLLQVGRRHRGAAGEAARLLTVSGVWAARGFPARIGAILRRCGAFCVGS